MNFTIRNVLPSDLDRVVEMEYLCFPLEEAGSPSNFKDRIRTYPESFFLVELNGNSIGYIHGASTNTSTFNDDLYSDLSYHKSTNPYQLVLGLGVLKEYRNHHLGQKLMHEMISFSKLHKKKSISLTCKVDLISYYENFGFENIGLSESNLGQEKWYDMVLKL